MEKPTLRTILKDMLNLSEEEASTYMYLLIIGQLTASEVSLYTEISYDMTIEILGKLKERQLVKETPGLVVRYSAVAPYEGFAKQLRAFQDRLVRIRDDVDNAIRSFLAKLATDVSQWKVSLSDAVNLQANRARDQILKTKEDSTTSLRDALESTKSDISSRITSHVKDDKTVTDDFVNSAVEKISILLDKFESEVTNLKEGLNSSLDTNLQVFSKEMTEQRTETLGVLDENKDSIESTVSQLSTYLKDAFSSSVDQHKKQFSTLQENLNTATADYKENLRTDMSDFLARVSQDISEWSSKHQDLSSQRCKYFSETIDSMKSDIDESANNLKYAINTTLSASHEELKTTATDLKESLSNALNQYRDSFENSLSETKQKMIELISNSFQSQLNQYSKISEDIRKDVISAIDKHTDWHGTSMDEIQKSSVDTLDETQTKISEEVATANENFTTATSNYLQELIESNRQSKEAISETIAGQKKKISKVVKSLQTAYTRTIDKNLSEFEAALSNLDNNITSSLDTNAEQVLSRTEELKRKINEKTSATIQKYTAETDVSKTSIADSSDTFSKESEELAGTMKLDVTTFGDEHKKDFASFAKEMDSNLEAKLTENTETLINNSLDILTSHEKQYIENVKALESTLLGNVDSVIGRVTTTGKEINTKAGEGINIIHSDAKTNEEMLKAAWDEVSRTALSEAQESWHLVTKTAILVHITDMLLRTKSTITIVIPDLADVPAENLLATRPQIRVHVVTGIDIAKDAPKIKQLLEKGNIRLWDRPARDSFGCARDAEEVLLAPSMGEPQKIVATISEHPGYVELFHKIFGPMWMASSKEVKLRDLV
ncbi:MAG: helix-turn-helix domain-containing protein [Candidatus Hodarchaeota archaeon]